MVSRQLTLCFIACCCPSLPAGFNDEPVMRRQAESLSEMEDVNEAMQAALDKVAKQLEAHSPPQDDHGPESSEMLSNKAEGSSLPRTAAASDSAGMINNDDKGAARSDSAGMKKNDDWEVMKPPVEFKYYRFTVLKTRGGKSQPAMSEFLLQDRIGQTLWIGDPAKASAEAHTSKQQDAQRLFDGDTRTSVQLQSDETLIIAMVSSRPITSFAFKTSNLSTEFDPVSFRVEGSSDESSWQELAQKHEHATPLERGAIVGPFILSLSDILEARPDASKSAGPAAAGRPFVKTIIEPTKISYVHDGPPAPCPAASKSKPAPPPPCPPPPPPPPPPPAPPSPTFHYVVPDNETDLDINYSLGVKDKVREAVLKATNNTMPGLADAVAKEARIDLGARPVGNFFDELMIALHAAGMNSCQQGNVWETAKNASEDDHRHILTAWQAAGNVSANWNIPHKVAAVVQAASEAGMPCVQIADLAYDATVAAMGGWDAKKGPEANAALENITRKAAGAGLDAEQQSALVHIVYHMDLPLQADVETILDAALLPEEKSGAKTETAAKKPCTVKNRSNAGLKEEHVELAARQAALSKSTDIPTCVGAAISAAAEASGISKSDDKVGAAKDAATKIANAVLAASATAGMDSAHQKSHACSAAAAAAASAFVSATAPRAKDDDGGLKSAAAAAGMTPAQISSIAKVMPSFSDEQLQAATAALYAASRPYELKETSSQKGINRVVKSAVQAGLSLDVQAQLVAVAAAASAGGGSAALKVLKSSGTKTSLSAIYDAILAAKLSEKQRASIIDAVVLLTPQEQGTLAESFKAADPALCLPDCEEENETKQETTTTTSLPDCEEENETNQSNATGKHLAPATSEQSAPAETPWWKIGLPTNRCAYKLAAGEEARGFYMKVTLAVDRLVKFINAATSKTIDPASLSIAVSRWEFQWSGASCQDSDGGFTDFKPINFPNGQFSNEQNMCGQLTATSTDLKGEIRLSNPNCHELLWLSGIFGPGKPCDNSGELVMMRIAEMVISQHRADGSVESEYSICGGKGRPSYIGCPPENIVDINYPDNTLGSFHRLCTKFGRFAADYDSSQCFAQPSWEGKYPELY